MRAVATDFYRELLSVESQSEHRDACREQVWTQMRCLVTKEMRQRLQLPLQLEELHTALSALPPSSCLGEDGLTPSFFLEY
ncbi:hypothetical protein DD606_26230 [Enterobacter cloacae complex sp. GF14B]|nr:hypothetical protein DD606_26230 [Enterobacter cloacae complex sp. GF14B]